MSYFGTYYPDVFGYIYEGGGTPVAYDKSGQKVALLVQGSSVQTSYRAYLSFQTGVVPDTATILTAGLRLQLRSIFEEYGINVDHYEVDIYCQHARIGAAVTTDDWGLTTFGANLDYGASQPATPVNSNVAMPIACVNVTGDSDFEIRNASAWMNTNEGPQFGYFALYGKINPNVCWLDVTYDLPSAKPLVNRFNWRGARLAGFSTILRVTRLSDGRVRVAERFRPRPRMVEA